MSDIEPSRLEAVSIRSGTRGESEREHVLVEAATYLVAARTRTESLVCEVELFDAERTCLFLVVVDELILQ